MADRALSLDDKYTHFGEGRVYLNGIQALVRLPMLQRRRDRAAGHNTAGFISGYRGSPLGGYDMALVAAEKFLAAHDVRFAPAINEDLAATAVWGTQQATLLPGPRVDGVFAMWYGKGPGVDRSVDALKHANFAGTAPLGGALALCGDDHGARSSTIAHQSDTALIHCGIPTLQPATVAELLSYGLLGFALSRFAGTWVGLKTLGDTVESGAAVDANTDLLPILLPTDVPMPEGGLNIRARAGSAVAAETRLFEYRHEAVRRFVRANQLDRLMWGAPAGRLRLGIVGAGKAALDVIEGLRGLGLTEARCAELGIALFKVGMTWPLEPSAVGEFAARCDEIFVVEEKQPILEDQLARALFNLPADRRPALFGKRDEHGAPLLPAMGEFDPDLMLHVLARRLGRIADGELAARIAQLPNTIEAVPTISFGAADLLRPPSFCAGCPHNRSTKVPEGSMAGGGIGCHTMAVFDPERRTQFLTHMGGEGANWIGQEKFTTTPHMFQNMGDGTYFHSGYLAIRAAVAAGSHITYKILLNGAIAMTGGQIVEGQVFDGELTAPKIARQLAAEGVKTIAVVSDHPEHHSAANYPPGVSIDGREALDAVQRRLRETPGVSALIYQQPCATERKRQRKHGKLADPAEYLFIDPSVCEGCGDCGAQSSCIAIEPLQTPLGRRRQINQSVCNKDYSCADGLCPSFISISGGKPRARASAFGEKIPQAAASLAEPVLPRYGQIYNILIAGIGGNGVLTVSALLGMAAHMDGITLTVLDNTGLAQRNGSVTSHVRMGDAPDRHSPRIPNGDVDLVIGADAMVVAIPETLAKLGRGRSAVVLNRFVAPNALFAREPDLDLAFDPLLQKIMPRADHERVATVDATGIATRLLGTALGTNLFLVGYAWQLGLLPLSRASILRAIELNGTAVAMNSHAFALGRIAAARPDLIAQWQEADTASPPPQTLDELLAANRAHLQAWGGAEAVQRHDRLVAAVRAAEIAADPAAEGLTRTASATALRLIAYKDEYEVARLLRDPAFMARINSAFEGDISISYNLAPPLFAARDKTTGRPRKTRLGSWMNPVFAMLARARPLRGTVLDVFGYSAHRRRERALFGTFEAQVTALLPQLSAANLAEAEAIMAAWGQVRGYDVVKDASLSALNARLPELLARFASAGRPQAAAMAAAAADPAHAGAAG